MKKNIVCGALFLICTQVQAVQTSDTPEKISNRATSNEEVQQTEWSPSQKSNTIAKKTQPIEINCEYRISGDTQKIERSLIINWAKYAVLHSFNFDFPSLDNQLKNLRACYTDNGWLGFTNALKNSGNINSIKHQNLTVSSTLDGEVQVIDDQENQWKITVPIKVFYKNDQEEITHFLNVYVIISWRNAFNLGIVQMITTPRAASISLKATSLREAMNSLSLSVTHHINELEKLQQLGTSFLTSLFVIDPAIVFSEMDRALSQPGLCLKSEHSNTKFLQHLIERPKKQALNHNKATTIQVTNLTFHDNKKPVERNAIKKTAQNNGFEWLNNQLIAIKSDIWDAKLPKLLSYFKESPSIEFYPALIQLDKIKVIKTPNPATQQITKESQLSDNKNIQGNTSLPLPQAPHTNKNQINQLFNVNLTLGRKMNGELVILHMKTIPNALSSPSNRAATLAFNANIHSNRAAPTQKKQQNNTTQLVQKVMLSKPSQIPKMTAAELKQSEIINCDYKIPDEMTKIDENLVIQWAEYATTQSFDFDSIAITSQLQKLKSCYTAKGWEHFTSALDKSGNIEAIKSQNFTMTSKVDGQIKLIKTRANQWDIELPLQVVYQNKQVNVTQFLNVNLTMGRKPTGEFGIMRILAALKDPEATNTVTNGMSSATQSNEHASQKTQPTQLEHQKITGSIDCDYKTPGDTKNINQETILAWAEYAATRSFNFDSESIDTQLKKLQSCYTQQGWNEFINALEKSGNIQAFKTKKLSAISQIDGTPQLIESRDNHWILSLPLKINYQFENGNVTQLLKIDLTIGRKNTGDLGIIQLNSTLRS